MKQFKFYALVLLGILLSINYMWGDDVTIAKADWGEQGTQSTGSEMSVTKTGVVTISCTKGYYGGANTYAQFYANDVITIAPASGITITGVTITASSTIYNGWQSSGSISSSVGSISGSTSSAITTWSGSTTSSFTISHDKQIRITTIGITYSGGSTYTDD